MTAACAGHPEPLWDAYVEGEHELERIRRQSRALALCRVCPERAECVARIDLRHDDGIRGGMILPTIKDCHRPVWWTWEPGWSGLGLLESS